MEKITIKPVETYLFMNNGKIDGKKLFKYVVMELILSGVLAFSVKEKVISPQAKVKVKYKYFLRGKNFDSVKTRPGYETEFWSIFKSKGIRLHDYQYVKLIMREGESVRDIKKKIVQQSNLKGLVTSKWYNSFSLTNAGDTLAVQLKTTLEEAEKILTTGDFTDRDKLEVIEALGNNIVLIEDFEMKELDKLFKKLRIGHINGSDDFDFESVDYLDTTISLSVFSALMMDGAGFDSSIDSVFDSLGSSLDSFGCSSGDSSSGCGSSCSSGCNS